MHYNVKSVVSRITSNDLWHDKPVCMCDLARFVRKFATFDSSGERGGSVVECQTPEREVRGSRPTAAVLCPWARHFTPRKYWLITQEAMAPSRHDWKIVDWDVKHNQPTFDSSSYIKKKTKKKKQGEGYWHLVVNSEIITIENLWYNLAVMLGNVCKNSCLLALMY